MTIVEAQKQLMFIYECYVERVNNPSRESREAMSMAISALSCMTCPHKNTVL